MASPAYQSVSTRAGANATTSFTIAVPTGVAADDILVLAIYRESTTDSPTATGFTSKTTVTESNHRLTILWKRATGADAGTYTVTVSGSAIYTEAGCIRVSGAITSGDPWDVVSSAVAGANVNAAPAVSVTTTVADTLLVYAATNFEEAAWTVASGMTERMDLSGPLTIDTLALAAAGGSGSKSATCADSGRSCSFLGALKPAGAGITPAAEAAALTLTANNAAVAIAPVVDAAAAITVTAYDATISSSTDITPPAEVAALTFTANNAAATVAVTPTAGSAALTFTANNAAPTIKTGAEAASLTVTAYDATISYDPSVPTGDPDWPWIVEAGPGFEITDDPAVIDWIDITSIVEGEIELTVGRHRPGEDAPACQLEFTIDNTDGAWTPGLVTSIYWPGVDLGMPVRFWRRDSTGRPRLRATVAADSIDVRWPTGLSDHCVVDIVASGFLRWMVQGNAAPASAIAGTVLADDPLGYWPATDGVNASAAANRVLGGSPAPRTTSGVVFGEVTGPDGVLTYPSVAASGRIYCRPPSTAVTNLWAAALIALAADTATGALTVARITTTSASAPAWRLQWTAPAGPATLRWIDGLGTETVVLTVVDNPIGDWHHLGIYVEQSGGNVDAELWVDGVLAGSGTAVGVTTGRVIQMAAGDSDLPGHGLTSVGQMALFDHAVDFAVHYSALGGYDGEEAAVRWARLCAEAGIPGTTAAVASMPMGPPRAQTLVAALRSCEDSDGGIMTDRTDAGLRYFSLQEMYNQDPAIELDASTDLQLLLPFAAARDDSTAATDVTITRDVGGTPQRVQVAARRAYADSATLSLHTDEAARAVASWRAHHGSQTDLRYDAIIWDAVSSPELLDDTLDLRAGHRIVLTGLPEQHPADQPVSLLLQGWTETHDLDELRFVARVSPARLYEVGTIADNNPATWDDTTARLDSDTSTLGGSGATTTATSMVVASDYGWSTTAVPYSWGINGERITVTSITAYLGGVQTATVVRSVNGIVKAHSAGATISLWRPPVIGL